MALKDIREQIKVILSTVNGIGVIHDYMRLSSDWSKFLDFFKDQNGKINGVMFARENTTKKLFSQGGLTSRICKFKFICLYGVKDAEATSLNFQDDIIEGINTAFNITNANISTLNNTCYSIAPDNSDNAGIQVDIVDDRTIGIILCHYAELSLYVQTNPS